MIGKKFYKGQYSDDEYLACAIWCTETQQGTLVDKGEYVECVAIEVEETLASDVPTLEQRINDIELALMELAGE